jgi:uncharacterized protein Yka (UPF0111/DUF47 family)
MNTKIPHVEKRFEKHMHDAAIALHSLEEQIDTIGGATKTDLHDRLHQVEVMENALRRNYAEVTRPNAIQPAQRLRKLLRLSREIESESNSLRHEVEFMSMGAPSSVIAMADLSSRFLEVMVRVAKQIGHALAELKRSIVHN